MGSSSPAASSLPPYIYESSDASPQRFHQAFRSSQSHNSNMNSYPSPVSSGASTRTTTMQSPDLVRPIPADADSSSRMSSPAQTQQQHIVPFTTTSEFVASPTPIARSPYPTPSSQSTIDSPSVEELARFREWERQQQAQRYTQPPPNMLAHNPYLAQQAMQQVPQYGQAPQHQQYQQYQQFPQGPYPLPGPQPPQQYAVRPGHKYGKVTASGNAKVIRGNVYDPAYGRMHERQHEYGEVIAREHAKVLETDVDKDFMKPFWD